MPPLVLSGSDGSSTGHEIEDEHDDGENQKDMNPSSKCVAADESQNPEDEENDRDCPKHFALLTIAGFDLPGSQICAVPPRTGDKVPDTPGRLPMRIKYEQLHGRK